MKIGDQVVCSDIVLGNVLATLIEEVGDSYLVESGNLKLEYFKTSVRLLTVSDFDTARARIYWLEEVVGGWTDPEDSEVWSKSGESLSYDDIIEFSSESFVEKFGPKYLTINQ